MIWTAVAAVGAVSWGVVALIAESGLSAAWLIFRRARVVRDRRTASTRASSPARLVEGIKATARRPASGSTTAWTTSRPTGAGVSGLAGGGAGRLVGPILAAQMGYLPGTIWIIVGVIFAGAVQDMVILFFSMRRDGQMARDEIGAVGGAGRADRGLRDHDHPAGGPGARGRQRAGAVAVGDVLARDDDPRSRC